MTDVASERGRGKEATAKDRRRGEAVGGGGEGGGAQRKMGELSSRVGMPLTGLFHGMEIRPV